MSKPSSIRVGEYVEQIINHIELLEQFTPSMSRYFKNDIVFPDKVLSHIATFKGDIPDDLILGVDKLVGSKGLLFNKYRMLNNYDRKQVYNYILTNSPKSIGVNKKDKPRISISSRDFSIYEAPLHHDDYNVKVIRMFQPSPLNV